MILNNYGITSKSWNLIVKTIESYKEIDYAIIFGSRAKGNYEKGSDIDIAIYGKNVDKKTALDLNGKLNEDIPTPYFYDIIAGEKLNNSDLTDHINRVGKIFYKNKKGNYK